jgi:hypothetical protein
MKSNEYKNKQTNKFFQTNQGFRTLTERWEVKTENPPWRSKVNQPATTKLLT